MPKLDFYVRVMATIIIQYIQVYLRVTEKPLIVSQLGNGGKGLLTCVSLKANIKHSPGNLLLTCRCCIV